MSAWLATLNPLVSSPSVPTDDYTKERAGVSLRSHEDQRLLPRCVKENVPKTIPVYFAVFSNRIYFC
jgi:hypothetical protein